MVRFAPYFNRKAWKGNLNLKALFADVTVNFTKGITLNRPIFWLVLVWLRASIKLEFTASRHHKASLASRRVSVIVLRARVSVEKSSVWLSFVSASGCCCLVLRLENEIRLRVAESGWHLTNNTVWSDTASDRSLVNKN